MQDKLQELKQKIETYQAKSVLAPELKAFATLILSVVKTAKDNFDSISKENLATIQESIAYIEQEHAKQSKLLDDKTNATLSQLEDKLALLKGMLEDIKKIKVRDGIDGVNPNPADVVPLVLAQIKLPEYEVFSLEEKGEQIVEQINALPLEDEYKIDASHIKNLPKVNQIANGGGWRNLYQMHDVSISEPANNEVLKYNSTTNLWENGTGGSGSSTFLDLTDTPSSYSGQGGKGVRVNAGADALEFFTLSGDTDEKVKYDAGDPTAGYVADKIIAGTGISLAEGTGANENKLVITNTFTEADTLSSVTGRGATTSTESTFSGGIISNQIKANTSGGFAIKADNADTAVLIGAGGGKNATFYDGVKLDAQTASRILSTDANKNITALDTTTYPDLTELSYVKGVTSAIQTQLNGKANTLVYTSAVFVSKEGNDANEGTRMDLPKLTIGSAITKASALISGGATGVRITVMDGATYTEDITLPTAISIDAKGATLVGTASITGGSELFIDRHFAASNNQNMLTCEGAGTGPAIYWANISDGRGTGGGLTGVRNVRNIGGGGKNLFARVGILYVAGGGTGVGDVSTGDAGHIHIELLDLYLAGNNAVGILGGSVGIGNANVVGWIDHILEIGTPTGTTGILMNAAGAVVKLTASEIVADVAYNISAGSLYLTCPKITGTQTGTPAQLMLGSADALTGFKGNGNWKVWYSDGSGDVQELALGADGTYLKSNGISSAPSFATIVGGTDEKVKYNTDDASAGFLADKVVAGTGISLAEGTGGDADKLQITNSAPDQTVAFTGGTNVTIGGTYPNFTITDNSGTGNVTKVNTPVNNQLAVWTGDGTLEGTSDLTYDGTNLNLVTAKNFQIAGSTILADASGTTTLSNIDALDATTEATIESAIDTLANLTSIQGRTVTLADAGANAVFGWDDTAGAYENLTSSEVRGAIGLAISDSPQFTAIELGHASDTTISRVSAGVVAIEGNNILTSATGLPLAGGTMTGDIQLGETKIKLDATLSGDGTWSGITTSGTLGATIAIGDLCYLNADDGRWELVDANLSDGYDKQLGISLTAGNDGDSADILLYGKVRSAVFPAFTIGSPLYISETAGDVTHTQPTTADVAIRIVGFALTAEDLMFNPSNDYIVHT